MRLGKTTSSLRWISVSFILFSILLLTIQLINFRTSRNLYPDGLTIGGVPVGGLDLNGASERLLEVYNTPIELNYNENIIIISPAIIGFDLDLTSMMSAADDVRKEGPFWDEYWDYLWSNQSIPSPIPLSAKFSETQLRTYLQDEIASRYDTPATIANPQVGTLLFGQGTPGTTIDIDLAVRQIENALRSPINRSVVLPLTELNPGRLSFLNLETFLRQTIAITGFDGIAGMYLYDLQNGQELHFVYDNGSKISTTPDVPFTAASIIKIPIMVSAFKRLDDPYPDEAINLITGMIEESGNDPADWLVEQYIDPFRGPLEVSEDMSALGLENTFLAGHFRPGSPLLFRYQTPANSRTDIDIELDPYNQTSLQDIGYLLTDIYQCAQNGGGALVAVFPGKITQAECQLMISALSNNNTPYLIEVGSPEGTQIAHKHGWVNDISTGVINTIGDAGIVYTPSGNYVLTIYFYHPIQLPWEAISTLIGDMAKIIYNYYNISS